MRTYHSSASWSSVLQKKQPDMSPAAMSVGTGHTAKVWPNLPQRTLAHTGPFVASGAAMAMARPNICLKSS